jgi:hypothetical protein
VTVETAAHGFFWYFVVLVLLAVLVGVPSWLLSKKRESKERQTARSSLARTSLGELQAQAMVLTLERHGMRSLLLSPSAASWFEALLQRTFEEQESLESNYPLLAAKYAFLLEQLVERIRPWSDAWLVASPVAKVPEEFLVGDALITLGLGAPTCSTPEKPTWVRLQATDSQWLSNFHGFPETVVWMAEQATKEARLASLVAELSVPIWDAGFLKAQCSSMTSGFVRYWILVTSVHGVSVKREITRISQPVARKIIPGNG